MNRVLLGRRLARFFASDPLAPSISEIAARHRCRLLVVGGAVRDLALGLAPRDADFILLGRFRRRALLEIERLPGARLVRFRKRSIESHRLVAGGRERDLVSVAPGSDSRRALARELARRDFTLNAIAWDPATGEILDPLRGLADLAHGRLRAGSDRVFLDDPLRMLRAVRLCAQRPLGIAAPTQALIRASARLIRRASPERVRSELDQILDSPRASSGIADADRLGLLSPLMPEIDPMRGLAQNRHHHLDGWGHTLAALAAADDLRRLARAVPGSEIPEGERLKILRWALLLHDLGKARTRTVDERGEAHFYMHERASEKIAAGILKRLRVPKVRSRAIRRLIELHLRISIPPSGEVTERAWRRLIRDAGDLTPLLVLHSLADKAASRGVDHAKTRGRLAAAGRNLLRIYEEAAASILAPPRLVNGRDVMTLLGLAPGPEVGRLLEEVRSRQVLGEITTREQALALLEFNR